MSKKDKTIALYKNPDAMTPFLPTKNELELREMAGKIIKLSSRLGGMLHPYVQKAIARLVEPMNSYYSNLIEGHFTHPLDIEKALKKNYSKNPDKKALQLENEAHVKVNRFIKKIINEEEKNITTSEFLCLMHEMFYKNLPENFTNIKTIEGNIIKLIPGKLRTSEVKVGNHIAPAADFLDKFMDLFSERYLPEKKGDLNNQIIALAASHHRLAWIHPFADGNGRVVRLFSEAYAIVLGIDANGLWSLSRGLSRNRDKYYESLARADNKRWNDFDGRGNLSDRFLSEFCQFILETIIDQLEFMIDLLELEKLNDRLEKMCHLFVNRGEFEKEYFYILSEAIYKGKIGRGDLTRITGKSENTARAMMNDLLKKELLINEFDGLRSPLLINFPVKYAPYLFPKLYPENIEMTLVN